MRQHSPSCLDGPCSPVWRRTRLSALRPLRRRTTRSLPQTASARPESENGDAIRWNLVARIRAELAAGTYVTADKWELALAGLYSGLDI